MILSPQTIVRLNIVDPCTPAGRFGGVSYGLSHAGYDLSVAEDHTLVPGQFVLASTIERLKLPTNVVGFVHGKSTWARSGMLVHNTVAEPGWEGYLTLELFNHGINTLCLKAGMGIVQVVFCFLDEVTDSPYAGKYQGQKAGPQPAIFEP